MTMTARAQYYQMEYQMVLQSMQLLRDSAAFGERLGQAPGTELMALNADLVELFAAVSERLLVQVRRREVVIDLVLAALIRDGCDCIADLIGRMARDDPHAPQLALQSRIMDRYAAQIFASSCVRALTTSPA